MEKILVIDDDAPFRSLICTALRDKGYEVLEAANGEEGIERAQRLLPDLILSDVHMGRVDGYDVLKMLDGTPQTAAIPLILMTGMADAQSQRESMELGADDYLAKPFTLQSLYATVGARLRRQTAVKRLAEQRLADLRSSISMLLPH
jgi:CheY-like chemotaxis protein